MTLVPIQIKRKNTTHQDLVDKAIELDCDNLFIRILKDKPPHPIQYCEHDIPEFGTKVSPVITPNNPHSWLMDFEFGYVLGHMLPKQGLREKGWYEVVFPYVNAWGNPTMYVIGLREDEFIKKD